MFQFVSDYFYQDNVRFHQKSRTLMRLYQSVFVTKSPVTLAFES